MLIQAKHIYKNFGDLEVLSNINIEVRQGEWVCIIGPSGSGKSTLLNILSLMDFPSSGEYFLEGIEVSKMSEEDKIKIRKEKIGLIFQQFHLIPHLNALENVMLAQYYHSSIDEEDAMFMLKKVGLSHRYNHLPSQLSGGEQQRLCIARALINNPTLLLADEPTGNLDEQNEKNILNLLCSLKDEGKSIVLITHNLELASYADRRLILNYGVLQNE